MLKRHFYNIRQRCCEIIDREYPEEKDKYAIVRDLVGNLIKDGCVILDAGCGHKTNIPDHNGYRVKKIGMDMVLEDVRNNKTLDFALVSNINYIPFRDESFNLIISNMVFEHLQELEKAFA